jgi:hypothetical protein
MTIKKQAEKATQAAFEFFRRGRTPKLLVECQLEIFNSTNIGFL